MMSHPKTKMSSPLAQNNCSNKWGRYTKRQGKNNDKASHGKNKNKNNKGPLFQQG